MLERHKNGDILKMDENGNSDYFSLRPTRHLQLSLNSGIIFERLKVSCNGVSNLWKNLKKTLRKQAMF